MTEQPTEFDLAQELRELGEQIKRALQVAREHPQTKEFERQVTQAVRDLSTETERVITNARADERVQKAKAQVEDLAQSVREGGARQDIERGLAKGVRALNEQIRQAIEDAEKAARA